MSDDRIERLERSVRRLRVWAATATILLAGTILVAARADDDVLRARGLVIVDEQGRERILIGAPIPAAENRVRTDMERVEEIWGPRFPRAYIDEYYPTYRHGMVGMLVLDENGFDRLAVGDSVPDPNIGRRIGPSTGIVINDAEGYERTGYGVINVDGTYRVGLGLDSEQGEAVSLILQDGGPAGLLISHGGRFFIGHTPPGSFVGTEQEFTGLIMRRGDTETYRLDVLQ